MTNKDKFLALVSNEVTDTAARNKERIKNRKRLRESQGIALKVLNRLDELGWTQKRLADELQVSPQQVSKIVKGKENLTLETQVKLQELLDIPILASYYEKNINRLAEQFVVTIKAKTIVQKTVHVAKDTSTITAKGKVVSLKLASTSEKAPRYTQYDVAS